MLQFTETTEIDGDLSVVWQTATDVVNWPSWDPHMEVTKFEGPFEVGKSGWTKPKGAPGGPFTLVAVEHERLWTTDSPMPMGKMIIATSYREIAPGRIAIAKEVELHGGFVKPFKMFFLKPYQKDIHLTFAALEREAARRSAAVNA